MTHEQKIYALDALIVSLAVALLVIGLEARRAPASSPTQTTGTVTTEKVALEEPVTTKFDALVVRSDGGFSPTTMTIKAGQTVRFLNETKHGIWVAASSTTARHVYPGTSNCGASLFDSCGPIAAGASWDFTFNERGTWLYRDNLDQTVSGTIVVK